METYYIHTNDPVIVDFVSQMARRRNAIIVRGFPAGYTPGCVDSLLIYSKYLNTWQLHNGRNDIITLVRTEQFKTPLSKVW